MSGKTIFMRKSDWEKWDAALRSGEYEQGRTFLEADGKYCCLGVLQTVLAGDVERYKAGTSACHPSFEWLDKHGISFMCSGERDYIPELGNSNAAALNDRGMPFPEIADLIASHVEFTDGK